MGKLSLEEVAEKIKELLKNNGYELSGYADGGFADAEDICVSDGENEIVLWDIVDGVH